MTGSEIQGLIGFILLCLMVVGFAVFAIVCIVMSRHSNSFKEIRKLIKDNSDIAPWYLDYCYKREKPKVEKLLAEHNYKLVEKKTIEQRTVYGCGKIEFADGSCEYQVHFSNHWFSPVDEESYKSLKKQRGKEVNFVTKIEEVYTNKEEACNA